MPWIGPWGQDKIDDVQSPRKSQRSSISQGKSTSPISEQEENKLEPIVEDDAEPTLATVEEEISTNRSMEIRNLKFHTGRLTEEKDTIISNCYDEGVNEFEAHLYGDSSFHLKFGFSNSQSTLANLVRVAPYSEIFIDYNGKLDHPDRMVSNYQDMWGKVCKVAQWNLELIPEWFYFPEMLMNTNFWFYGEKNNGAIVNDIDIPEWAEKDPHKFVMLQRKFIESSTYIKNINLWVDQIFGAEQQSVKYKNIFFKFWTEDYFKQLGPDHPIHDRILLKSLAEFFQLPSKLFDKKHQQWNNMLKNKSEKLSIFDRIFNVSRVIQTFK
jgi:hypothetical protein